MPSVRMRLGLSISLGRNGMWPLISTRFFDPILATSIVPTLQLFNSMGPHKNAMIRLTFEISLAFHSSIVHASWFVKLYSNKHTTRESNFAEVTYNPSRLALKH